ncbi:hypothetical protein DFP72DRAFT_1152536 [Ephemerocybe angulata]|uniref:Uncharacterized protein n=1 Tax=Ephemerocybe angulata TaxID=980116 RepID=A0A8H6HFV1_9AGAR|nr:hypothetical protein DFP72DRAFT_1152536 [Tulosesus angulatus]
MATITAINQPVVNELAKSLAWKFAETKWLEVDPQVALAIALNDRSHSVITAARTRTVANVAARVWHELPPRCKEDFRRRVWVRAAELLKQALDRKVGVDEIRIRAYLVAELRRVGIARTEVLEQAMNYVEMRGAAARQLYLGICDEMWKRSVNDPEERIQDEQGAILTSAVPLLDSPTTTCDRREAAVRDFTRLYLVEKQARRRLINGSLACREYIQHNPDALSGRERAIAYVEQLQTTPGMVYQNITSFSGEGYGLLHFRRRVPGTEVDFATWTSLGLRGRASMSTGTLGRELQGLRRILLRTSDC